MKQYPAYKDSGVDWIGAIPNHWTCCRTKYRVGYEKGRNPKELNFIETPWIYLTMEYLRGSPKQIFYVANNSEFVTVDDNEILLLWDGSNAGEFIRSRKGILSSTMALLKILNSHSNYVWYYLKTFERILKDYTVGMGIPHVNGDEFRNNLFLIPPIDEQSQIAAFLDYKTQQIDDLIGKKQKLIELLKEERTAIINQAVTKGLDPNVPMKDSGIESLGEIPEHCGLNRLKSLGSIRYGLGQPPKSMENGLPLIRATNIQRGKILNNDMVFVNPEELPMAKNPILRKDEIIIVRSGAYTGDSAIIPTEYGGSVAGYDMVFTCLKCHPDFIAFSFLSHYVLENQLIPSSNRAAQPHLNAEELGSTIIVCPPYEEQIKIAIYLKTQTERVETTTSKIQNEIELLSEYRTSLINAAITGKIDVRNQ